MGRGERGGCVGGRGQRRVVAREGGRQDGDKTAERHGERTERDRKERERDRRMKKKIMQNACLVFAEIY